MPSCLFVVTRHAHNHWRRWTDISINRRKVKWIHNSITIWIPITRQFVLLRQSKVSKGTIAMITNRRRSPLLALICLIFKSRRHLLRNMFCIRIELMPRVDRLDGHRARTPQSMSARRDLLHVGRVVDRLQEVHVRDEAQIESVREGRIEEEEERVFLLRQHFHVFEGWSRVPADVLFPSHVPSRSAVESAAGLPLSQLHHDFSNVSVWVVWEFSEVVVSTFETIALGKFNTCCGAVRCPLLLAPSLLKQWMRIAGINE
mmetsp:Transcript_31406/g.65733  ORF Transcript_31406/g.65733 Transcript_31406/m.65733 type:complete len:259 (-) Transcript_31406:586-1362(-)